jgi:hypothetical protein
MQFTTELTKGISWDTVLQVEADKLWITFSHGKTSLALEFFRQGLPKTKKIQ